MTPGAISADHAVLVREAPKRGSQAISHAQRLAGLGARASRWLLPWIAALLVSGSLAYAMDLGLRSERSWSPAHESVLVTWVRPALEVSECPENECPFTQIEAPEGDW
jgi:hypothetical protein